MPPFSAPPFGRPFGSAERASGVRVEGDRCPGFGADFGAGFDRFAVDSSDGVPADGVPATVAPVLVPLSDAVAVIGPPPAKVLPTIPMG
ncbi:MAG: hypothetical protein R2735_01185 [Microthrixaceae bacterium]